ncbi:phosphoribosylglycinamide formyltransferase [Babesia caballi]|uniref:Phosphoribosylglycinamide formyltransferase n=1 Tax=Babesia caballi TaxID=5871 RepID=A0AAV4LPQ7_BABCB|nr:phosphoribosylglycinamide formyltransferase [Babesia caballi]
MRRMIVTTITKVTSLPHRQQLCTTLQCRFRNCQQATLGENYDTLSRQKGTHKSAKAAEVEAGLLKLTEEFGIGWACRRGWLRLCGVVSFFELFAKRRFQLSSYVLPTFRIIKIGFTVPQGRNVLLKAALVAAAAAAAIKLLVLPHIRSAALPVEVGEADIHDRHYTEEDGGAFPLVAVCEGAPVEVTVGGVAGVLDNAVLKRFETVSKSFNTLL